MKEAVKRIVSFLLVCCIAMTAVTLSMVSEAEAASFTYSQNVSSSKVTTSSTSGSMPSSVSAVKGGRYYNFNLQTSDDYYITSAALYVKNPGDSDYTRVYRKTSSSGVHYVAASYCINNTTGTLSYYWRIDYITSSSSSKTVKQTSTKSITVTAKTSVTSTYNSALNDFLSVSVWANNASWSSSKTCQSSPYGTKASGCCAYVADLVYELYGAKTPSSGTSFTSVNDIRAGDVLKLTKSSGGSHWIYVYGRDGDELYVVAGNEYNSKSGSGGRVALTYNRYTISGSKIIGTETFTLNTGYHYE